MRERGVSGLRRVASSPSRYRSITTGLCAPDVQAVLCFPNDLPPAHVQVGVDDLHLMAPTGQILDDVGGDLPLQLDVLSSGPLDPGRVQGLLGISLK